MILTQKIKLTGFFLISLVLYIVAMMAYTGSEMADDGAFFLRYAENMLQGEFWVWNLGEEPVWGASAPLYPLLIAVAMFFGASPVTSLFGVGIILSSLSFSAMGTYLVYRFGIITGLAFLAFTVTDVGLIYFSASGLESPLVFLLLSLAVWGLLSHKPWLFMGTVAGLLMVHKLDMIPAGGLLLLALWVNEKKFPLKAIIIAAIIAAAWYIFAWVYFGAPVPNSFLTKSLHQNDFHYSIDWRWFGSFVVFEGMHALLTLFAILSAFQKRFRAVLIFLGGTLAIHLIAYTIKYPFEPYNWYAMPSVFSLVLLSALGFYTTIEFVKQKTNVKIAYAFVSIVFFAFMLVSYQKAKSGAEGINHFIQYQEYDRAEAGRWVNAHTPESFKVATWWGNPAYFSNRYVYDGSFLNRRYESGDLIKKYKPEIIILQNNPGSTPMNPVFAATKGDGYRIVKVFDKSYAAGMDYFFAVLAREDVINQITDVSLPQDLMLNVSSIRLGETYGIVKANDSKSLFVHPGMTPTTFKFDVETFRKYNDKTTAKFIFKMAPNIPQDAIDRGAANVQITIMAENNTKLFEGNISVGKSLEYSITDQKIKKIEIVIDKNGNPDTDWALVFVQ